MSLFLKLMLITFLFSACIEQVKDNGDSSQTTSAFSENVVPARWSTTQFPLSLKLGTNFGTNEITAIEGSANSWTDSVQNEIQFFDTTSSSIDGKSNLTNYEDSELGVYKVLNWPTELPPTALAVTQIFGQRYNIGKSSEYVKIQHADILVNYENFTFTTDDSWGYDLESVILHEMGHFLGLQHDKTSSNDSVMFPTISRYNNSRNPKYKDTNNLLALYGRSAVENNNGLYKPESIPGEKITITIELYPNGKEIIKTQKGLIYETNCNHHGTFKH
jgi:hypothetical protein